MILNLIESFCDASWSPVTSCAEPKNSHAILRWTVCMVCYVGFHTTAELTSLDFQVGDEGAVQLAKAVEDGGSKKLHTLDVSSDPNMEGMRQNSFQNRKAL